LLKRALSIHEKALGSDHSKVALSLNNLAALYLSQGRYADAEPLYKRSLAIREKALGPNHPDVAGSLNNLADLYGLQGRYAEAELIQKRSLAIKEKAFGPDHPDVALSLNNLGGCSGGKVVMPKPSSCTSERWRLERKRSVPTIPMWHFCTTIWV
jgi:tetratricopeptide (TPR) repeat protein